MAKQTVTNAVLAEKLDHIKEMIEAHVKSDDTHFQTIYDALDGNGKLGMKTRIDRIEQLEESRKWQFKYLWCAVVTSLIGMLSKIFFIG